MLRRLLVMLALSGMMVCLSARAEVKPTEKKPTPDEGLKGDTGILVGDAAIRNAQLKRQFESFRQKLAVLAGRLENGSDKDKDKAKSLRKALKMVSDQNTESKFDSLIRGLTVKNADRNLDVLSQAIRDNDELRGDLKSLIKLLSRDDATMNKEQMEKTARLLEQLKELIAKQERVRAQTEMARKTNEELKGDQGKVTKETKELADGKKGGKEDKTGESKGEGKSKGDGKEAKGEGKDDTTTKGEGKSSESKEPVAEKEGKAGEGKSSEGKDGKEGKAGEGKDGKSGEGKSGEGKDGKGGEGKEGKAGEGKEGKGGEGKEGKEGKGGEGKGDGKGGEGKEGKGGDGKEGKGGEGKGGEGKGGEGKEGKGGEGKGGEGKGGKGGEGKGGEGKEGKGGEGKGGGEGKDGKAGEGKAGQGEGKGGQGKGSEAKGDGKGGKGGEGKGEGKGNGKPGEGKGGKGGEGKGGEGKGGKGGEGKAGEGKGKGGEGKAGKGGEGKGKGQGKGEGKPGQGGEGKGGEGGKPSESKGGGGKGGKGGKGKGGEGGGGKGGKGGDDEPKEDNPVKKQIEDANKYQKQAETDLDKKMKEKGNDKAVENQTKAIEELEKAKKKLEDLLKQMREEEIERMLADLEKRCRYMLALQIEVRDGTVTLDKDIQKTADKKPDVTHAARGNKLRDKEEEILREADAALKIIQTEGSAVAFAEVFEQVKKDMEVVVNRLGRTDTGKVTVQVENDIIETLKEMIDALKKAQRDMKNQPKEGKPKQGQGQPQDQKLIDMLAELKMIYAMQKRVNSRTELYGKQYKGEQAPTLEAAKTPQERETLEMIRKELKDLSDRQDKIGKVTKDIATGKNEAK